MKNTKTIKNKLKLCINFHLKHLHTDIINCRDLTRILNSFWGLESVPIFPLLIFLSFYAHLNKIINQFLHQM